MADNGKLTLTLRERDSAVLRTAQGDVRVKIVAVSPGRAEVCIEAPRDIVINREPRQERK